MGFEWDSAKATKSLKKHGVDFADACLVLSDTLALTFQDTGPQSEQRYITIGMDPLARVLVVVYTWRGEDIRLISARKATPSERKQYEAKP